MAKVCFPLVHKTYFYRNELKYEYELPVTEDISQQVLTLPMYPSLTEGEIDYVTGEIADFLGKRSCAS